MPRPAPPLEIVHKLDPQLHEDLHKFLKLYAKSTDNPAIERTLAALLNALQTLTTRTTQMFEELETKVAALTSASDAAEALLDGIKAKLDEIIAGGGLSQANKDKLAALSAGIGKEGEDLAAAVARNTPAEEPPPPTP